MAWTTPRTWNVGELVTKAMLDEQIRDNMNYLFSSAYPVGSIYISTVATNPGTTFGFGTWVAFGAGRTIIGVGTSDAVYAAGATGGESTHLLDIQEMTEHTHDYRDRRNPSNRLANGNNDYFDKYDDTTIEYSTTTPNGASVPFNVLGPYIVAYMWQRTA